MHGQTLTRRTHVCKKYKFQTSLTSSIDKLLLHLGHLAFKIVRVRCPPGNLCTTQGAAGNQTSNLPVTSQPALPLSQAVPVIILIVKYCSVLSAVMLKFKWCRLMSPRTGPGFDGRGEVGGLLRRPTQWRGGGS